ncbi:hypothetical protein [Acinetobacter junii]|uniref:hypothetical protein n=1 Tax=Acinetobacter junii TaxID=40215 RepID=UPI002449164F|nr:hypothetical protein [Acinetobacter junii]MDH0718437.1 hypothetical protein [Acinetobacter junii]
MEFQPRMVQKKQLGYLLFFFSILITCLYFVYAQAKGLTWQFDDLANLKGLASANTYQGIINFVLGGGAGPTGRPISLLSFVPNVNDWPNNPWGFVQISLVWHVLNSILVYFIAYHLFKLQEKYRSGAWWMACFATCFWAFSPIQVSAILMPVQRMTLVSAFFSLATLAYFIWWRIKYAGTNSLWQLVTMSLFVSLGVLLSLYSKENGILTILYIGLCEILLLNDLTKPSYKKLWFFWSKLSLLIIPIFLLIYGVIAWNGMINNYTYYREFNLLERLATELIILLDYIKQTILPRAIDFGPFHDGYQIYSWAMYQPWLALLFWIGLVVFVSFLFIKNNIAWVAFLTFSVFFFLSAHLIESTFIPLELYFEHRNYLAILGISFFLPVLIAEALYVTTTRFIVWFFAIIYSAIPIYSTQQVTYIWGQPLVAAELWVMRNPESTRAIQTLSWQYDLYGFKDASIKILADFYQKHPEHISVGIGIMTKMCSTKVNHFESKQQLLKLIENAPKVKASLEFTVGLAQLGSLIREGHCVGVSIQDYQSFLERLLKLARVEKNPKVRHHIYYEIALNFKTLGEIGLYVEFAKKAFYDYPSLSVAQLVAVNLFQIHDNDEAVKWINESLTYAPNNAAKESWVISLNSLKKSIEDMDRSLKLISENHE